MIPADINLLIHHIYQGVMEDELWSSFLEQANRVFQSDLAVLVVAPKRQPGNKYLLNRVVNSQKELRITANHWIALDPFQDIAIDTPVLLDELGSLQAIEESAFYQSVIKPTGIRYILAMNVAAGDNHDLVLKLRLARHQQGENFSPADRELLQNLIRHIQQALRFLDQMAIKQIERNAFADAINQFMLGTLILDKDGMVVASNRVARDTIEQHPALGTQEKQLQIHDRQAMRQLQQALLTIDTSSAQQTPIPATISINRGTASELGLIVRTVRPEDALTHPVHAHAVVFISDPLGTPEISADTLQKLFGFTDGESRVAAYLANGHSLNETADALSISINTTKTHARNIYEKTGVNKQTKFIQLISNSVARVS